MDDNTTGASADSPVRLLLVSDTHLPLRHKTLPDELLHAIERADVVLHAGDWVDVATLDRVKERVRCLVGVYGNNDGAELRARLPRVARVRLAGLRFGAVHETGAARGREERCVTCYPDLDVLVFGHSHIPWDTEAPGEWRLLNPGSPTDRRRPPYCTYMTCVHRPGRGPRGGCSAPSAKEVTVGAQGSAGPTVRSGERKHVMIDEVLIRELLDAADDHSALVLLEGRARVAGRAELDGEDPRSAAVVLTRAALVDRMGTSYPTQQALALVVASLDDAVGKLGA